MKRIAIALLMGITLQVAGQIPDFTLSNSINGKSVSLSDYRSYPGVVVIFTSNECPYDDYYLGRIKKLVQEYNEKVPVILINAHTGNGESAEAMKAKAAEQELSVPYLSDKGQTAMQKLGATKSPEVFLLKSNGKQFAVFYRGAIDDNAQVEADIHEAYLIDAINALLSNQKLTVSTMRPVGCTIHKR